MNLKKIQQGHREVLELKKAFQGFTLCYLHKPQSKRSDELQSIAARLFLI